MCDSSVRSILYTGVIKAKVPYFVDFNFSTLKTINFLTALLVERARRESSCIMYYDGTFIIIT